VDKDFISVPVIWDGYFLVNNETGKVWSGTWMNSEEELFKDIYDQPPMSGDYTIEHRVEVRWEPKEVILDILEEVA
jgi:hypothetical protein